MKKKVKMKGWNKGFHKISCTKILMEYCNIQLSEAKQITDNILNEVEVIVLIDDNLTNEFKHKVTEIGIRSVTVVD